LPPCWWHRWLSLHSYGLRRTDELPKYDYISAISKSDEPEAFITRVSKALKEAGCGDRIKIAYDEWNLRAWQHPGFPRDGMENYDAPAIRELVERRRKQNDVASRYTMADALFSASFFNACLRHAENVGMANIAPIVNTRGPLRASQRDRQAHTLPCHGDVCQRTGTPCRQVGT
jgi:alpha-N-arabinofuranosidase